MPSVFHGSIYLFIYYCAYPVTIPLSHCFPHN